jgi:hypothetical protein
MVTSTSTSSSSCPPATRNVDNNSGWPST